MFSWIMEDSSAIRLAAIFFLKEKINRRGFQRGKINFTGYYKLVPSIGYKGRLTVFKKNRGDTNTTQCITCHVYPA